jgi:hypothetical protein
LVHGTERSPYTGRVPKNQHHPTPEELDERVKVDLDPEEAISLLLQTGPHPEDEEEHPQ